jgi:2-haloacid dehalogenase
MQLASKRVLSFDCYGTLIDWESGIRAALRPWHERTGGVLPEARLLEAFGRHEAAQQALTPRLLYGDLLATVLRRMGEAAGAPATEAEARAFGRSIPDWPAFEDSPAALALLKQRFCLIVLSNVDEAGFQASRRRLGVAFDAVLTAEAIGSYKPDRANFAYLLGYVRALGFTKAEHLHVAQSLFHDHAPAKAEGLETIWIDRAAAAVGATAMPVTPDGRYPSMAAFAAAATSG